MRDLFKGWLFGEPGARLVANPELLLSNQPATVVVDLKRRYDISLTKLPTLYRLEEWEAIDRVTFDPDPNSRWYIKGRGATTTEAVSDLLAKLGAEVAKDGAS